MSASATSVHALASINRFSRRAAKGRQAHACAVNHMRDEIGRDGLCRLNLVCQEAKMVRGFWMIPHDTISIGAAV